MQHTDLQRGTFKSTLIKTFCPIRLTLSANPSTLSLARSAAVAWKKREERADADLRLLRERVDVARENMDDAEVENAVQLMRWNGMEWNEKFNDGGV